MSSDIRRSDHYFNLNDDELRLVRELVEREVLTLSVNVGVAITLRERVKAEIERRGL